MHSITKRLYRTGKLLMRPKVCDSVFRLSEEEEQCAELSAELQRTRAEWQSEGGQLREEVTRLTSK